MAKQKSANPAAVLKYGPAIAKLKANTKPKQWHAMVKYAHAHGHTVAGQLSGAPSPLMERTGSSIRKEATKTVAASYKPVQAELSRRETAAKYLSDKRSADDTAYNAWLSTQTGLLDAQARAADTTLASQQANIARDLTTAQAAARADSLHRVAAQAGNVSDPSQSAALDTGAADSRSAQLVANAREHSAEVSKIGADSQAVSQAAMIATAAVRAATHTADTWTTMNQIGADRSAAAQAQAKDRLGLISDLKGQNATNAENNRQDDLAAASLNLKKQSLVADIAQSAAKYKLDHATFKLNKWKAHNQAKIAQAKIDLGYDQIKATKGQKAADRALNKWVTKYQQSHQDARNAADNATSTANSKRSAAGKGGKGAKGVTSDERKQYQTVETIRGFLNRGRNAQWLVKHGFAQPLIDLAVGINGNAGMATGDLIGQAKRVGVLHPGYFWPKGSGGRPDTAGNPNTGYGGRPDTAGNPNTG